MIRRGCSGCLTVIALWIVLVVPFGWDQPWKTLTYAGLGLMFLLGLLAAWIGKNGAVGSNP